MLFAADDFGMTAGVSAGIVESIRNGVVGATTAMVCVDGAEAHIARFAPEIPGRIGAHLQLTDGVPRANPAKVRSLLGEDGRFPRKAHQMRLVRSWEVEREWRAQLAVLAELGITPTHLDSHHHAHRQPGAFQAYRELAREMKIPARGAVMQEITDGLRAHGVVCADVFVQHWSDAEPTMERLLACIAESGDRCPEGGIVEVMCHPALLDDELRSRSTYAAEREAELRVLTSAALPSRLNDLGYDVITIEALR
ncbi:MAG: ChbG/HpnK family deacetylase [Acidobacteriota bacterium]